MNEMIDDGQLITVNYHYTLQLPHPCWSDKHQFALHVLHTEKIINKNINSCLDACLNEQ
jgi:hypothetical protein